VLSDSEENNSVRGKMFDPNFIEVVSDKDLEQNSKVKNKKKLNKNGKSEDKTIRKKKKKS